MLSFFFAAVAAIYLFLLLKSFKTFGESSPRLLFLRILLCAVLYDNTALVVGNLMGEGGSLELITKGRYLFHATVLPFLTLFALSAMRESGVKLGSNKVFSGFAFLFTACALGYGFYHEVILLELEVVETMGHIRMSGISGVPPMATIATNVFAIVMGVMIWRAGGPKWLFGGALTIFVINGASASLSFGFLLGNLAEVVFIYSLLRHEKALRTNKSS